MTRAFVSGNEAFAQAALEAGVNVVAGYPGTPSSEVVETVAKRHAAGQAEGVYVEWSSNEAIAMGLLAGAASILTTALTTLMVQARHLFYSISLIEKYKGMGKYKPYMIFGITDETYSLMSDPYIPVDKKDEPLYRFLVTLFDHCYWITGCVLGNLLGEVLPFSTDGLEFSMTALFVASFTEQWITMRDHVPAITGFVSTLLCLAVFGPERFLIPALLLMTLILTLLRKREEAQA
jgi:4-azaleucine resistance transporter AzlC